SAAFIFSLLFVFLTSVFAQVARDDVQLQILMVTSPRTDYDRRGQLLAFKVTDRNGVPVQAAEMVITTRNGTITDDEGHSQGTTITYFTNAQGLHEVRVRRNKAGAFVVVNVAASSLNRSGVKSFNFELPSPPVGIGLKVATFAAIGAAGAAGAILASRSPAKPPTPAPTEIIVGVPTIRR